MKIKILVAILLSLVVLIPIKLYLSKKNNPHQIFSFGKNNPSTDYAGSVSCKSCHEKFHELWSTSHHGKAMQPINRSVLENELTPMQKDITVGDYAYRFVLKKNKAFVLETSSKGKKKLPVTYLMGGKNIYYFLTPWEKGRLQTLPVAYDLNTKEWFNTTESSMRHFTDIAEEPFHWTESPYTFNTSCHGCHVSQLSKNYDTETDAYHTTWNEPGINCETCHGSATEHVRFAQSVEAGYSDTITDWKIISTSHFTAEQHNSSCASCHAKMYQLTKEYKPGESFYNHFGLVVLDNPDFYPDGRDLGENYTFTSWSMSPCVKSGEMSCMHCHTSSGRYRFEDDNTHQSCLPCHQGKVDHIDLHSHHEQGEGAPDCIDCHMPQTHFARMTRSDHSMLPPTPSATAKFQSPNACNLCHTDKSVAWADSSVRTWHKKDYQAPVIYRATLIDDARHNNWQRINDIFEYIKNENSDPVFKASLINLLQNYPEDNKWPVIKAALTDSSPLVRSAVCEALSLKQDEFTKQLLLKGIDDEYRLVRHKAATSLAYYPDTAFTSSQAKKLSAVLKELENTYMALPDQWSSYFNLGNLHMAKGDYKKALEQYEIAAGFTTIDVAPLVNMSLIYNYIGNNEKAHNSLLRALEIQPDNISALFNLGLLYAEMNKINEAEKTLKKAFDIDSTLDAVAYNLATIALSNNKKEAVNWIEKAVILDPQNSKYLYTYAFCLNATGQIVEAEEKLLNLINTSPLYIDAYLLLSNIYLTQKELPKAKAIIKKALKIENLSQRERLKAEQMLGEISKG